MSVTHPIARRQAFVNNEVAAIDTGGGTSASLVFYTGSPPSADMAPTGTLLGTVALVAPPSFPSANSSAQAAANGVPLSGSCIATGVCGYYRVIAKDGATVVHQGLAGTSSADFIFNTTSFINGGNIIVNSYTITGPN